MESKDSIFTMLKAYIAFISFIGVISGGILTYMYSFHIGYFPQGISAGDTLSFLYISAIFGVGYSFLLGCLIGLGITLSTLYVPILNIILNRFGASEFPNLPFKSINSLSIILSLLALPLIYLLSQNSIVVMFNLVVISIMEYLMITILFHIEKRIKDINLSETNHMVIVYSNATELLKIRSIIIGIIIFAPILFSGKSGQFLEMIMRSINIRTEHATVYVEEPYASLLPLDAVSSKDASIKDHTAFDNITVLFDHFGSQTVISGIAGKQAFQREIPKDKIIVITNQIPLLPKKLAIPNSSNTPVVITSAKEKERKADS